MSIAQFIQEQVFLPRLSQKGALVVYDPDRRYHDLALSMASDSLKVVDACESSIESRETAINHLRDLGQNNIEGVLVYVPSQKPIEDEDKQKDPFALYGVCGEVFPQGDADEFLNLCLKAKPDQATEIRRVFSEDPSPSFAVIDAIGGGTGWPVLEATLNVESSRDILYALLAPNERQKSNLTTADNWVAEAKQLFFQAIGLKLITRGKSWSAIADELWRYVLFSEFVLDLPEDLPESLTDVPTALQEARPLINDLCERLRSDQRLQGIYVDRAEKIEEELQLVKNCASVDDFGPKDTFPFEERHFLRRACDDFKEGKIDSVREILAYHSKSVWVSKGESQAQWSLVEVALKLSECVDDNERQLHQHISNQKSLVNFYLTNLREVDRLHREFEQAVNDNIEDLESMNELIAQARTSYHSLIAKVQPVFVKHLEKEGWPLDGSVANTEVFERFVNPVLQESGKRVAYVLIDALRYELGLELEKQLSDAGVVDLHTSYACLPSTTKIGMASLLPSASQDLRLVKEGDSAVVMFDDVKVENVQQRMDVLRKRFGQRFIEMPLNDFALGKQGVENSVELFVLRSTQIDAHLETDPEAALQLVHGTLKRIRTAVHKLKSAGFSNVVIATDHGFFINIHPDAGMACAKPNGNWTNFHDRCLLGVGTGDSGNAVISCERLNIRGDFESYSQPYGMATYRSGLSYFHGGASLQEAVVPVITVQFKSQEQEGTGTVSVQINYKQGAKQITSRMPVFDLVLNHDQSLFAYEEDFEVLIEAQDKKGNVVGEAKTGGPVNPATGMLSLRPNQPERVTLKMTLEFEGKFTVKVLDPATLTTYCKLDLETDYAV